MAEAIPICRRLLAHFASRAEALALDKTGSSNAARIAIMAMTTSSSINVNARARLVGAPAFASHDGAERFMPSLSIGGNCIIRSPRWKGFLGRNKFHNGRHGALRRPRRVQRRNLRA